MPNERALLGPRHVLCCGCTMGDRRELYAETLRRAAWALGGATRLAAYLGVEAQEVEHWLTGAELPPLPAFLTALDVIADGPYARSRRRIRVAAIKPNKEEPKSRS